MKQFFLHNFLIKSILFEKNSSEQFLLAYVFTLNYLEKNTYNLACEVRTGFLLCLEIAC